ncbi:probable serine/threonine-protein kinase DDB_G0278901 isoform X1 [Centruroides vittatus]|uniref:probable serine/threonine-protein kinase DDB_G0278901 isoform X1 n=1 Tax=Centruroides vittatus TaxID=120091 RepID=UPI00350FBB6D
MMIPFSLLILVTLLSTGTALSIISSNGTVLVKEEINPGRNNTNFRRFPFTWRRAHFPIIPPRLRVKSVNRVVSSTTSTTTTTTTTEIIPTDSNIRPIDIFEISSSDNSPAIVWPVPRRPASRRFRTPSFTTSAPRVLPKLLQPKPTRPAIYSLDGFVPKPSIQRISTTEAPLEIRRQYLLTSNNNNNNHNNNNNNNNNNYNLHEKRKKKQKSRQSLYEDDDDKGDKYGLSRRKKPVSRYTAFARKGIPGIDYPVNVRIPQTNFDCSSRLGPGLYADPETDCQVWHMCPGGSLVPRHSFLCPNGTIFNEFRRICDWWYNVRCEKDDTRKRRSVDELAPVFQL